MPFCQSYFAALSRLFFIFGTAFSILGAAFSVPSPLGEVGWGLLFSVGLGLQFAQE